MKTKLLVSLILISSCLTTWAWFDPSITQGKVDQIRIGQTTEADLVHFFGRPSTRQVDLRHHVTLDFMRSVPMPWQGYTPFIRLTYRRSEDGRPELCGGANAGRSCPALSGLEARATRVRSQENRSRLLTVVRSLPPTRNSCRRKLPGKRLFRTAHRAMELGEEQLTHPTLRG